MVNAIIGKIEKIGDIVSIPYSDGTKTFERRDLILDCSTYDRYTGDLRYNYPSFDFCGSKVNELDNFSVGEFVEVSFVLAGVKYNDKHTGEVKYFTKIQAYKIEHHERTNKASVHHSSQSVQSTPQMQKSKDNYSAFPSPVDDNGEPVNDDDVLPF